ncbi:MAG: TIGR02530 family flagellar biosynthesis protein [Candidatus Kryptonium sp.]
MAIEVNGVKVPFIPAGGIEALRREGAGVKIPEFGARFEEIFKGEIEKLKFSNHALKRMEEREVRLSEDELKLLNDALFRAEQKNTKDVLILLKDVAFIVNVKNRTVITVVDSDSIKEHVFTNIDGAVII